MNPIIEFCVNNLASGSQKAFEVLDKDPDLDVVEYGCTTNCGICAMTLFAIVNGERVMAETPEELVEKVYRELEDDPFYGL
ncbi:YuzB family protein [Salirhabdus sp. Marseille-P4669]|uniref:YuzB family protein n=1 Tax=Salirhabdus sp. Marseille-P4669 TaxID=2042310 RepID=UPI000C7D4B90|nr:YuzB family protein [Salirhabdus sp. Marseille-P4669]